MATKRESVEREDKLGIWDQHIHTTINKIDNQQGPTVKKWDFIQYFIITHREKNLEKNIYIIYI